MASCAKCGQHIIRKRPDGYKKCRHCGVLPGVMHFQRSGEVTDADAELKEEFACNDQ